MTIYSTGLRVTEVIHLLTSDIDSKRMAIRVRQGEGRKDRYVPLFPTFLTALRQYWKAYRPEGFLSVLHTWNQRLQLYPHVHCVVLGGGLSPDGKQWISSRKDFFLPVRVLSSLFQKKFLYYLAQAFSKGELSLSGNVQRLTKHEQKWTFALIRIHSESKMPSRFVI